MTTFTVWKFDRPGGADEAAEILKDAEAQGLVKIIDRAVVSWPEGAKRPTTHHVQEDQRRGTGWGAFWGLLFGALFFVPVLGAAAGAGLGALHKSMEGVGIGKDQMERLRSQITEGTSALFVVTDEADLDRLGERFHGMGWKLIDTNLTDAERAGLVETFGGE
ncbi:MAG: DUF1269 domain-containing protein [Actinomycetes bacterium]